jgi:two-component system nitrogen regulation response regulator NtrX
LKNTIERVIIMNAKQKIAADDLPELGIADERPASSFRFPTFKEATDAYQREFIQHKLAEFDGNVSKAAEDMGVDRSHLYRRNAKSRYSAKLGAKAKLLPFRVRIV